MKDQLNYQKTDKTSFDGSASDRCLYDEAGLLSQNPKKQSVSKSLRQKSCEWFFGLNEIERVECKEKYFPNTYIAYDNKWGFHFTFGQIEEMYQKAVKKFSSNTK